MFSAYNPMAYEQAEIGAVSPCSKHSLFTLSSAAVALAFEATQLLSTHAERNLLQSDT